MSLFQRPHYTSDTTQFLAKLKVERPELEAEQRQGRALLWDTGMDAQFQAQAQAANQVLVYTLKGQITMNSSLNNLFANNRDWAGRMSKERPGFFDSCGYRDWRCVYQGVYRAAGQSAAVCAHARPTPWSRRRARSGNRRRAAHIPLLCKTPLAKYLLETRRPGSHPSHSRRTPKRYRALRGMN